MIVFRMLHRTQRIGQFHWPTGESELPPYFSFQRCPFAPWLGSAALPPGVCFSPLVPLNAQARALKASRQRRGGLIVRLLTWSTDAGNLIEGVGPVGKVICVVAAALAVLLSLPGDASADSMTVKHHAR